MSLKDENVRPAYGLAETGTDFPVGEVDELARANFDAQVRGDVLGQHRVRTPGVQAEAYASRPVPPGYPPSRTVGPIAGRMTEPGATTVPGANHVHGPTSRVLAYRHLLRRSRPHLCPRSDNAVDQMRARADLGACGDPRVPLQDCPGEKGDILRQLDGRVQVGVLRVEHGDALPHPLLVDPAPQHGLGRGQLAAVVDAAGLDRVGGHQRHAPGSQRRAVPRSRRSGSTRPGRCRG